MRFLVLIPVAALAAIALVAAGRPLRLQAEQPAPEGNLTLAEAEELAQRCNPTLAQAAARLEAARGHWLQVGLYPNPVVGYLGTEIGDERRGGQQGGFLSQQLVTAKKLQWNRDVACRAIQQAEQACLAQRDRVLTDVRRGFYDVLAAQRRIELTEQLVKIGREGVKAAEDLLKAKEVARSDAIQARIEADSAEILMERAKNRYAGCWRGLAAVLGDPTMRPLRLSGNLEDDSATLQWDETLAGVLAQSPQLVMARAGVAQARAAVCREMAARVPNLDLQVSTQYDSATRDTIAGLQIGVPIPLYNRNQGNIQKAQAELVAAESEVQRVELELQQRLAAVFEQYRNARFQVDKYAHDILPNARSVLELTQTGYRHGEFGYLALLTAQRTFFQTNLAYLDALADLRATAAVIEGNLLCGSLSAAEPAARGLEP
jgi:cobalt-zinc-cadmium efflux system outer membrane protein